MRERAATNLGRRPSLVVPAGLKHPAPPHQAPPGAPLASA